MERFNVLCLALLSTVALLALHSMTLFYTRASSGEANFKKQNEQKASGGNRVSVRAAGKGSPWINLSDGFELPASYSGTEALVRTLEKNEGAPSALASGDFDEDGVADLVSAYDVGHHGIITLHRGNVDSIYPNSPEAKRRTASGDFTEQPFLPNALAFETKESPEFLGVGDFDADGHLDVTAASRGSSRLYLLSGDGHGRLGPPRSIDLAGGITALVTGEFNRRDGLTDIAVGIAAADGPKLLVFAGPEGALRIDPEQIALPAAAIDIALGQLDEGYEIDLAVTVNRALLIVQGRDRASRTDQDQPKISRINLSFNPLSLAAGDFTGDQSSDLALLDDTGTIHVYSRKPEGLQINAKRQLQSKVGENWQASTQMQVALSSGDDGLVPQIIAAQISSLSHDDLVVIDKATAQLSIVNEGSKRQKQETGVVVSSSIPRVAVSLDLDSMMVAALPMRLNDDALSDLVILERGHSAPSVVKTQPAAVFTVTNTLDEDESHDPVEGSLRWAIVQANTTPGADRIEFAIPGPGPYAIAVKQATLNDVPDLPITDPVTLDATTQPGFAGSPLVEVFGGTIGGGSVLSANAISISSGSTTLRGLIMNTFQGVAVRLKTNGGNIVEGNYFGPETGNHPPLELGNARRGLTIDDSANNVIGGTVAAARNVISHNGVSFAEGGVRIIGSSGNMIQGNFIGLDATGTSGLPNDGGGIIITDSINNTIGGATPAARNIISSNGPNSGVGIDLSGGGGNLIQSNFIGTDLTGTAQYYNFGGGLSLTNSSGNTIGGTTAGARNVISGNSPFSHQAEAEVFITGGSGNVVEGNYIGTDATGAAAFGSGPYDGVHILDSSNNRIGGSATGAGNIIAGHTSTSSSEDADGVEIEGSASTGNRVQGNHIGTNAAGDAALPNSGNGVYINNAADNTIGAAGASSGINVISGNGEDGIKIIGNAASGNRVQGNFIGVKASGQAALGNGGDGIEINGAPTNLIGDLATGFTGENVISANGGNGIFIIGAGAQVNIVRGNFIGTDRTGTADLGNASSGVNILGADNNIIGGANDGARNVISGNDGPGIVIQDGASGTLVLGNKIGTDVLGVLNRGNTSDGVFIVNAPNNTIGGTTGTTPGGDCTGACNLISANNIGVQIAGSAATGNSVQGNYVGTTYSGTVALPNRLDGISINGAPNNTVGGASPNARNLVSGNDRDGISIATSTGTLVQGNFIGTRANGTEALGNSFVGLRLSGGGGNTVGGAGAGDGNLISGNNSVGLLVGSSGNALQGNLIGTDISGLVDLGNSLDGIRISFGSSNTIGGAVGARNIISGNDGNGVMIEGDSRNNLLVGNLIGTQSNGSSPLGNAQNGVRLASIASAIPSNNSVGGQASGAGNTIAHNGGHGVTGPFGIANPILGNSIFSNGGAGIQNGNMTFPILSMAAINSGINIQGTLNAAPTRSFTIQFFSNAACDSSGRGEGQSFIGSTAVTTNVSGTASFNVTFQSAIPPNQFITATATDAPGNTSEFSACRQTSCGYSVSPTSQLIKASGGSGSVNVIAPVSCDWTATSNDSWIVIVSETAGAGNGVVSYEVRDNFDMGARTGTLSIAGQVFTVTQSGTCTYSISPVFASFVASGGVGSINVDAPSGCNWTAVSNEDWITILSGGGSGNGVVNYKVLTNGGAVRQGTLTIAGEIFRVKQKAP